MKDKSAFVVKKSSETTLGSGARHLFSLLLELGMPLEEIEARSGIDRADLDDPECRVPVDGVMKLAAVAGSATGDPALGLHLAERRRKTPHHFITHLALSCDTLEEALQTWIRYARLESDTSRVSLRREGTATVLRYVDTSPYQAIWLQELYMATVVTVCRSFVSDAIQPLEVRFQHAEPSYSAEYKRIFRAPVRFDAGEVAIVFRREDMACRLPTRNPLLRTVLGKQAESAMARLDRPDTAQERVTARIVELLPQGRADLVTVARALGQTPGGLRRELKRENLSFSLLREQVRQRLSLSHLDSGHRVKEVAYLLGYSDPSAFQHAFRKWFGQSPGKYRESLQNA